MKVVLAKLSARSICECGEPVLHDGIPLGTEYRIYPETIRSGFVYRCGKCGNVMHGVAVVDVDNRNGEGHAPLPLALFDLILLVGAA